MVLVDVVGLDGVGVVDVERMVLCRIVLGVCC